MTETENQAKTLEELSGYFDRIDGLSGRVRGYNDAVKIGVDSRILGSMETDLAHFVLGDREINHTDYQNELRQYRNPQAINIRVNESMRSTVGSIAGDYKARLDEIVDAITAKLNGELKEAKSKSDAYRMIEYALRRALRESDPVSDQLLGQMTQDEANRNAALRLEQKSGARTTFVDPTGNSGEESSLNYRIIADGKYGIVEEKKDGDKVTYCVNKEAIKKLAENPMAGAILYAAKKPRAQEEYVQAA